MDQGEKQAVVLGALTLDIEGGRSARTGRLIGGGWRTHGATAQLALIAQFGEQTVTVNVELQAEEARRLGMAA